MTARDNVTVQLALLSLFLLVVAFLVMRTVSRERKEYARFKRLRTTDARQRVYRKWLKESFLMFGGLSAVVLLAVAPLVPSTLADTRAWAPIATIVEAVHGDLGTVIVVGLGVAVAALLILPVIVLRAHIDDIPKVGDIGALIPRNGAEIRYGAGLAINAGVFEEMLFRLAIPALVFGITGNGPLSFVIATILFGLLHSYQGSIGVVATFILGLAFSLTYVLSGSILLAIGLHMLIDLRSLVLIPLVVQRDVRAKSP